MRSQNNHTGSGIGDLGPLGRLLVRGEAGHDTIPELYPIEGEPVIDKPGRGAFAHTDFDLLLRLKGIRNLVIAGVTTDVCVSTTMREANDRGLDCLILQDATAASEPNLHFSTLDSVKAEGGIFGSVGKTSHLVATIEATKKSLKGGRTSSPPLPLTSTRQDTPTPAQILTTMNNINSIGTSVANNIHSQIAAAAAAAGSLQMPMDPQMNAPYIPHH